MSEPFAYDLVDYPSFVRPQTHPSRLAAIARLHGLAAAAPSRCRLLEVGCGDGGNLLPLALAYPQASFVGIDLSAPAIARGEALRRQLGLDNLHLQVADLDRWSPPSAPFDYVIAHGFYSWVPAPVRNSLLRLCRQHLSPHGVAYISYNALPGCHLRRMMWQMLRHHVRGIADPQYKLQAARDFLRTLDDNLLSRKAYSAVVREEARQLLEHTDPAVLFHDDLAELNEPFSITDFLGAAAKHDLQFLGEADYFETSIEAAAPAMAEQLRALAEHDIVAKEQLLDFLKGRRFRQTLLCHAEAPLQRDCALAQILHFDAVGQIRVEPPAPSLAKGVVASFSDPLGGALSTDHPLAKAVLLRIAAAFPAPLTVRELIALGQADVHTQLGPRSAGKLDQRDADEAAVLRTLILAFRLGLVVLHCEAPRFATVAGERPRTSALVRTQLDAGAELVTSLRPSIVRLDSPLTRELVRLLDGTRDRIELVRDLSARMQTQRVSAANDAIESPSEGWEHFLAQRLDEGLAQASAKGLLVG